MKAFLVLSVFFLLSYFDAVSGQEEMDRRMEAFIREKLLDFPNWMKENGHVPERLHESGDSSFTLKSTYGKNEPFYDLGGQFSNRVYHGADNNIRALEVESNLNELQLYIVLAYGDGANDFIEGSYSLHGQIFGYEPVHGDGKFNRTRTTQLTDPLMVRIPCRLAVNDEGYFEMWDCLTIISGSPDFQNFTLSGLQWSGQNIIVPIVETWYKCQLANYDRPLTDAHYLSYMTEIFATTPAVDIVGDAFTPKFVKESAKKLGKSPKYIRKPNFDDENQQWGVKGCFSYN